MGVLYLLQSGNTQRGFATALRAFLLKCIGTQVRKGQKCHNNSITPSAKLNNSSENNLWFISLKQKGKILSPKDQ